MSYLERATVKRWTDQGYGFATLDRDQSDVFVHHTVLKSSGLSEEEMEKGVRVLLDYERQPDGRLRATMIELEEESRR